MELIKKVVILGPESTGKSTLCEQLSTHYNTVWVPEYARSYLLEHGMNYSYEDLLAIAKGQLALEDEYLHSMLKGIKQGQFSFNTNNRKGYPIFIDTNMHVMKVWCEFVFGQCHDWILNQIAQREYDLYLLCNIDLPWVKDELREYPDIESRQKLIQIYRDIMINQPTPWVEITGDYDQRLRKAISAVDHLLATQ